MLTFTYPLAIIDMTRRQLTNVGNAEPTCCAGSTITQPRGSTSCSPGIGKAGLPDWLHKRCLRGGDHGKRIEGIQASRCVGEQRIQLSRAVPGGTAQALYPAP